MTTFAWGLTICATGWSLALAFDKLGARKRTQTQRHLPDAAGGEGVATAAPSPSPSPTARETNP